MKDIIDERNERERISRSIIKYWNVNYVPGPAADTAMQMVNQQDSGTDAAKQAELEAAYKEEEVLESEDYYNATTGSFSGAYGKGEIKDEVTRGQIDKILHERTDTIRGLFEQADGN